MAVLKGFVEGFFMIVDAPSSVSFDAFIIFWSIIDALISPG